MQVATSHKVHTPLTQWHICTYILSGIWNTAFLSVRVRVRWGEPKYPRRSLFFLTISRDHRHRLILFQGRSYARGRARGKSFKPGTAIHCSRKKAYSDIDCGARSDFTPTSLSLILVGSRFPHWVEYDRGSLVVRVHRHQTDRPPSYGGR